MMRSFAQKWNQITSTVQGDKKLKLSYILIILLCVIGVFGKFIANDVPLVGKHNGKFVLPAVKDVFYDLGIVSWKDRYNYATSDERYSFSIATPIPYSSSDIDHNNAGYVSPFDQQQVSSWNKRHWLGTDQIGRDVTAGFVSGCRISLLVIFFTCLLALLIGVPLGLLAGYYGDSLFRLSILGQLVILLAFLMSFYLLNFYGLSWQLFLLVFLGILITYGIELLVPDQRKKIIPLDSIINKIIELFKSIPGIVLLFVLLGMVQKSSLWYIVVFIGLLSWYQFARYIRVELMSIREMDYIQAQKSIGQSDWNIIFRHCLKIAMPPVIITLVFFSATIILTESTLSFLGIGLPVESVSWGTMLSEARKYFPAWWLAVFPGLGILGTILALHTIAEHWISNWRNA